MTKTNIEQLMKTELHSIINYPYILKNYKLIDIRSLIRNLKEYENIIIKEIEHKETFEEHISHCGCCDDINEIKNEKTNKAEDYLDEQFPKGDKRRGEAMVLYALTKIEERKELIERFETKFNTLINKYGNYGISGDMIKQQIDDFKLKEIENEN